MRAWPLLALLMLTAASSSLAYEWEYVGMDGISATVITTDPLRDRILVGTYEGFHYLDQPTGTWTEWDWEGWIGRAVWAIDHDDELPLRVITGRENGLFLLTSNRGVYRAYGVAAGLPEPAAQGFEVALHAWPNPLGRSTQIGFLLSEESRIALYIYDPAGRKVATLIDQVLPAGAHAGSWDTADLASGVYHARLGTTRGVVGIQLVVVK